MFTSVGQCAELITQPCGLKVKVTVEGHEFEPWIWCRLHISFTPGRIFFKCWSNVCLSEIMCRTHLSYADSRSRSQLKVTSLSLEFWGRSIAIQTVLLNLGQMFAFVRWFVEPITQRCRLKVKVTTEGHPSLSCLLHISWTFCKIFKKLCQMFALVRQCAEPITQACRLKVKITVKGHEFEPWISCSLHRLLWKIFIKFWSNIRLREMMCRTHNSTMQTQGHNWRPPVWALNFEACPLSFCVGGYSCPSDCLVLFIMQTRYLIYFIRYLI